MDDPWGSPWAAAEHRETPLPPVASADAADAAAEPQLPPPARTSIPSLSLPSLAEPSPWADDATPSLGIDTSGGFGGFGGFRGATDDFDDSAFGDWATATPTATTGLGLDSGLSPNASNKTSNNNFSHFPGDASPIAWPSPTASRSPSRAPNRSPATSISARRAPSIEPKHNEPKEPEWERPQTPSPDPKRRSSPSSNANDSHTDHAKEDDHDDRDHAAGADTDGDDGNDGDDGDDVVEGDSPITSVDDDAPAVALPKVRDGKSAARSQSLEPRQPLRRKASNKVQELVEHFDGLVKTLSVTSAASTSRRPSPSPSRITKGEDGGEAKDDIDDDGKAEDSLNDSDDDDDNSDDDNSGDKSDDSNDDDEDDEFADFEGPEPAVDEARPQTPEQRSEDGEVNAASEEKTVRTPPVASPAASVPSVPAQSPSPVRRGRPGAATAASAATEPPLLSITALLDHYGPITPYTPPDDKLDALFAAEDALLGLPAHDAQPQSQPQPNEADAYVPDHVLTDSFTAVSERRVWYRIARAGSSRRYNQAGGLDDDNYRPITWATSTAVRPDTLRIVRRWVEEDAFTGRAVLGGARRSGRRVSSGTAGDGPSHGIGAGVGHGRHESEGTGSITRRLFGWDSTSAPLTLDAVYRKKRPGNHHQHKARPMSMGSNTMAAAAVPATRHSLHLTGPQRAGLGLASPLSSGGGGGATFSGGLGTLTSGLGNPPTSGLVSATTPESSSASEWTQPALYGGSSKSLAAASSPVAVSPIVAPPAADNAGDDGDDDDWGEMVSSPAVGAGFSGAGSAAAALAALSGPPATAAAKSAGISPPTVVMSPPVVVHAQPPPATADTDRAVDVILQGLPDLSYMAK